MPRAREPHRRRLSRFLAQILARGCPPAAAVTVSAEAGNRCGCAVGEGAAVRALRT